MEIMNRMVALVCERCGGAINAATLCCEYCGTKYKEDEHSVTIDALKNKTEKLRMELLQQNLNEYILMKINQPKGE